MTKREAMELTMQNDRLRALGISYDDCDRLRRISLTLRRWSERECGIDGGCIERDETTNRPFWHHSYSGRKTPIADKETGALVRLRNLMAQYPTLTFYVQGDPRGCSLYILKPGDVPAGQDVDSFYTRGVAVA